MEIARPVPDWYHKNRTVPDAVHRRVLSLNQLQGFRPISFLKSSVSELVSTMSSPSVDEPGSIPAASAVIPAIYPSRAEAVVSHITTCDNRHHLFHFKKRCTLSIRTNTYSAIIG